MHNQQQPPLPGLEPLMGREPPPLPPWERFPETDRLNALLFLAKLIGRILQPTGGDHHD